MIDQIRSAFFKNALGKLLAGQKRQRKIHTLNSARTIGLLFDATTESTRKEVQDFAQKLEKEGKKVQIFGFFNIKQAPENPGFNHFAQKESTWARIPKSEKAIAFASESFELLLSFNPSELPQLNWIAAASKAAMKIGLASVQPNDFDIQLETPDGKGFRFFTEELRGYLDKIVLTKS